MATVKELRDKIKHNNMIISNDLQHWDIRTKPGMEGLQNKAKAEMGKLTVELRQAIAANAILMVMEDSVSLDNITRLATFSGSDILDFYTLERKIIEFIYQGMDTTNGFKVNNEFQVRLNAAMSSVGDDFGATSMATVAVPANKYGIYKNKEDVVALLHSLFTETYDTELKNLYLATRLNVMADEYLDSDKDHMSVMISNVPNKFLNCIGNVTNFWVKITSNENLPGCVLYTDTDTEQDVTALIIEAIKNKKLKGA